MGTTTTYLGLYKPAHGEEDYDDEVNASLDAIDLAIHNLQVATGVAILTGTSAPSDGSGSNGDIYLRSNGGVYKKAAGTWTLQFTLPGSVGAAGASFLVGNGAPLNGLGANGDTYMDRLTGALYSPKASNVWPASSGTLKGTSGLPGPTQELKQTVPASGSTLELDTADASVFDVTLNADCTITILPSTTAVPLATLILRQGGAGSFEVTWGDDVAWPAGDAPTLSTAVGAIDMVTMLWDGSQWLAGNFIGGSEAPIPTPPTLAATVITAAVINSSVDEATGIYTSSGNGNGGSQGLIWLPIWVTRDTDNPVTPIVSGLGMSSWAMIDEPLSFDTAGATRRRLYQFIARQSTPGTAAPLRIEFKEGSNTSGAAVVHSSVTAIPIKVVGTAASALTVAAATAHGNEATAVVGGTGGGPGGSATAANLAFSSPAADSLQLVALAANLLTTSVPPATITHEAGWTIPSGADLEHGSPSVHAIVLTKLGTDPTYTGTFANGVTWAAAGVEIEQG